MLEYAANTGTSTFKANFISELGTIIFSILHKKVDLSDHACISLRPVQVIFTVASQALKAL